MERLTKYICDRAHGAEGVSAEKLTGAYCRGKFEATALVERLAAIENILGNDYDLERLKEAVKLIDKLDGWSEKEAIETKRRAPRPR